MHKDIPILLEGHRVGTAVWSANKHWVTTEDGPHKEPFRRDISNSGAEWLGFNVNEYIRHRLSTSDSVEFIELTDGMTNNAYQHRQEATDVEILVPRIVNNIYSAADVTANLRSTINETRTVSSTGGEKGVKPQRYSLIPREGLDVIGEIYDFGSRKYAPHNWRKGYEWSKSYDALQRHLTAWWDREENDPESGLSHLGHAGFHIFALIVFSKDRRYAEFDDRYGSPSGDL